MVLFPNMPHFRAPHRRFTKVHQIIATRGRFAKKEQNEKAKGWIVTPSPIGRDINPLFGVLQDKLFFPCRGIMRLIINRKDGVPFTGNNDFTQSKLMQP